MSLHYTLSSKAKNLKIHSSNHLPKQIPPSNLALNNVYESSINIINILKWFGESIAAILGRMDGLKLNEIEEIRLRVNQPLLLHTVYGDMFINSQGKNANQTEAYLVNREDLIQTLERMTQSSIYAAQDNIKEGFLTLPGGHRVGLTGKVIMHNGEIQIVKHISALNVRIAREVNSNANILSLLYRNSVKEREKEFCHTLIISSPRGGKTTLLRSLIQNISNGVPNLNILGKTVGVVDERGEIAGMCQGVPTYDLGIRTDVLDGCSKAKGILMLIRSMAPQIIATDEVGHRDDIEALSEALRCGVRILTTAHASSIEEALERPSLGNLLKENIFERLIILSRRNGPGTIEGVFDLRKGRDIREVLT